jgi:hypothetical protein
MSYLYLTNEQGELITAHGKAEDKKEALTDKLSKTGLPYTAFKASECEPADMYEEVKQAVAASFTKRERTLLAYTTAEAKSLNELQKKDRRTAKQKIGARCGDLYKALKKRQVEPRDTERKVKTDSEFILELVDKGEARITKSEKPDFKVKVVMDLLAALRAALQKQ